MTNSLSADTVDRSRNKENQPINFTTMFNKKRIKTLTVPSIENGSRNEHIVVRSWLS